MASINTERDFPVFLFHQGTNYHAHDLMGAHPAREDGKDGYIFRTWAPRASRISIVGDFNGWEPGITPMERVNAEGLWEGFVPGLKQYDCYKYAIEKAGSKYSPSAALDNTLLDQMKDVRERAAKSYSEAELVKDKKTGKSEWKGGDNGINELLNIGVINKSDLKKFADNPAGLISKAVNGMMKKGFSDSQIGQRLEDLGDDLMLTSKYWQRSVKDVQESINQQKASGKWLTETQQESIVKFRELNRQLSQLSDARQVAFVDGFMKSLDPKVTEEFMKNLSNLTPYFTKLGEATGSLFEAIMKIVNWFNRNDDKTDAIQKNMGDAPPLSNDGMKQNLSNLVPDQYKGAGTATTTPDNSHSLFNTIKGLLFDDKSSVSDVKMSVSEAPITNLKQGALNNLAMTTPAYNLSPVFNLNPTFEVVTEVPLTINSDTSRLSDYVDFTARASRDSFLKSLTLTSLSGQSNGG